MTRSATPRRRSIATLTRSAFSLTMLALLPLAACEEDPTSASHDELRYGPAVALGEGTARTYIVQENGEITELGVALSEGALRSLPTDHSPGGIPMPDGHHTFDYVLQLPAQNPTHFRFVGLGWNPAGHEPPGIYDLPHFDFHFYTITDAERRAILPSDPQYAEKAGRFPAAEYIPQGYLAASTLTGMEPAQASVPMMGMHWIDPSSPELHGATFTKTFIYGTWDGKMTFAEPMITKAYLETKPNFSAPIGTAQRYSPAGYYPSSQRIYWDADSKEYRVALSGFAKRN